MDISTRVECVKPTWYEGRAGSVVNPDGEEIHQRLKVVLAAVGYAVDSDGK